MTTDLKSLNAHFGFGENWRDYVGQVGPDAIDEAKRALARLIPGQALEGARFLDIGCGSGLHTLAAVQLGIAAGLAIDIDPDSVAATKELLSRFAPAAPVEARVLSIFDANEADLGQFDVVYSWGVLHHTGAMWEAVSKAASLVRPGGLFALALYQKRLSCTAWTAEKRFYTRAHPWTRTAIRAVYKSALLTKLLLSGENPWRYVRDYKSARGMNFHNDVHDWLGGYPYESASPDEITQHMSGLGFECVARFPLGKGLGILGTGCAEFTFRRQ
jgi:2-polyprenyl-6-hydroxyphenyl methylase/3-demethylubiquinone-9 3-methyltransferase